MSESRYRIAMVAPGPFPSPRGSQVLVRELAEALSAAGHVVHIVAYGGGDARIPLRGVHVHRTPRVFGGRRQHGPGCWRIVLNLLLARTLYRVVRDEGIDVIHAHNYEAPVLAYAVRSLTGVPVVYHGHNVMSDELVRYFVRRPARWAAARVARVLDREVPRRADFVVALSERMAVYLHQNGVAAQQLAIIPPGVMTSEQPAMSERVARSYPGFKVIAYAGNLDPYQDLSTLVRAMAEIRRREPRALLVIATHASDARLQRKVARAQLSANVQIVEVDGFDDVQHILQRADVVVCPRTSWSGFPIKLLNYMAAGRAIVAAHGAATAVRGGAMVVVPDGSAEALAQAIVDTLADPVGRDRLGAAARKMVDEAFAWPHLIPRIVGVYESVISPGVGDSESLQNCKKVLQNTTLWGLMEGMGDHISAA